jgi:hypothetical protein
MSYDQELADAERRLAGALRCANESMDEIERLRDELYAARKELNEIKTSGGFLDPFPVPDEVFELLKHRPTVQAPVVPSGPWDYFIGNANGKGLIRIECQGRHIASMPRGKESEEFAKLIVDSVNAHLAHGYREQSEVDRSSDLWDKVYNFVADCECGNRGPSDTTDIIVGLLTTPPPSNSAVREAVEALQHYRGILESELGDVIGLAAAHGWTSRRVEDGEKARQRINQALAAMESKP